jgi:adenosylmethionine-8-amino-7-oxononanoate aminotransferase
MALHAGTQRYAGAIVTNCIKAGVLMMVAFCNKTRILIEPPLCITEAQMETVLSVLGQAVERVSKVEAAQQP